MLHGASIHVEYRTDAKEVVSRNFIISDSELIGAEILRKGQAREIRKGNVLTHSLFHLDAPTFSVVVRREGDKSSDQYLLCPGIAMYLPDLEEPENTLVRLLETLGALDHHQYERFITRAVLNWTGYAAVRALMVGLEHCPEVLKSLVTTSNGELAWRLKLFLSVAKTIIEQRQMLQMYHRITDDEQRQFAAMLLNIRNRDQILALLGRLHPGQNAKVIASRLCEQIAATFWGEDFNGDIAAFALAAYEESSIILSKRLEAIGFDAFVRLPLFRCLWRDSERESRHFIRGLDRMKRENNLPLSSVEIAR